MGIFIGFSDTIRWGSDNQIYRIRRNGLQEFRAITIEKRQPIRFVKLSFYYAHSALPSSLPEIADGIHRPILINIILPFDNKMTICAAFLPFRLVYGYSLRLLFPLFPHTPRLSVVKHVVKNRFLNTLVTGDRKRFL